MERSTQLEKILSEQFLQITDKFACKQAWLERQVCINEHGKLFLPLAVAKLILSPNELRKASKYVYSFADKSIVLVPLCAFPARVQSLLSAN